MKKILFSNQTFAYDLGLLLWRVSVSIMILTHGWSKIANFNETLNRFPDTLGFGQVNSLQLAIFAEFFCSILVGFGFMTRVALIPLVAMMFTVAFVVHGPDSFQQQELPLLYLISFIFLLFTGPGKYTMDNQILKRNRY